MSTNRVEFRRFTSQYLVCVKAECVGYTFVAEHQRGATCLQVTLSHTDRLALGCFDSPVLTSLFELGSPLSFSNQRYTSAMEQLPVYL